LAEAREIDRGSAVRIAPKRHWPKQRGNDGIIRVAVPRVFLDARRRDPRDVPRADPAGNYPQNPRARGQGRGADGAGRARARASEVVETCVSELIERMVELRVREGAAQARADELRAVVDKITGSPDAAAWTRFRSRLRRGIG